MSCTRLRRLRRNIPGRVWREPRQLRRTGHASHVVAFPECSAIRHGLSSTVTRYRARSVPMASYRRTNEVGIQLTVQSSGRGPKSNKHAVTVMASSPFITRQQWATLGQHQAMETQGKASSLTVPINPSGLHPRRGMLPQRRRAQRGGGGVGARLGSPSTKPCRTPANRIRVGP